MIKMPFRKARRLGLIFAFGFAASACTTVSRVTLSRVNVPETLCEMKSDTILVLSGGINEDMLACAQTNLTSDVETVEVSSFGGSVTVGRKIGRLIGERPRTLIVKDYCLSSCGNYFVPASEKVILRPEAFIGLHGTIDPYTVFKNGGSLEQSQAMLDAEDFFAVDFGVPLGWRIYRPKNYTGPIMTPDMSGKYRKVTHRRKNATFVVEPPFLKSCLPHVKFIHQSNPENLFKDRELIGRINNLGGIGTGSLRCKPDTGQKIEYTNTQ